MRPMCVFGKLNAMLNLQNSAGLPTRVAIPVGDGSHMIASAMPAGELSLVRALRSKLRTHRPRKISVLAPRALVRSLRGPGRDLLEIGKESHSPSAWCRRRRLRRRAQRRRNSGDRDSNGSSEGHADARGLINCIRLFDRRANSPIDDIGGHFGRARLCSPRRCSAEKNENNTNQP